jgi:hypothetical protein
VLVRTLAGASFFASINACGDTRESRMKLYFAAAGLLINVSIATTAYASTITLRGCAPPCQDVGSNPDLGCLCPVSTEDAFDINIVKLQDAEKKNGILSIY